MRPKIIVYCLSIICLLFGVKGFELNKDIQNTLKENARQSESSIMEIGMCFDWYGVIIVDSVVKTSHGMMTPAEMIDVLKEESGYKDEYLEEKTINYPISFNGKMRYKIPLDADISKEEIEKQVMQHEKTAHYLSGKSPKKVIIVPKKIVNIVF